ncbi:MAG: PVC-type heme-binding CxxCH protein, partial [Roseimicrobium sp.]
RDVTPHLGRISLLEDKDGDGYFETNKVFADDLAWPTGVIWANGGVFVIATPDVLFFKDTDDDGKADTREVVFTGLGTGLKMLNVQGLANCPQWGLDNRIHIQCGGGNRGKVKCLKRPDLPEIEIGGRDLWFDPRTFEFGLEAGGAQFGMSFDNYGRKFACSNSDHLQFFVCDDRYAARNPFFDFPSVRQSVAVDGGAAEVFRISPDEPWRIIRTRWRIAGVVKGAVEGGGRVSGYFTGATGTTVYRGDVYGPDFVNNTFTGDAGGQLVHRKIIVPDGVSVKGMRPADEQGFEFAASKDTWVRVVNFSNAPDGCLHLCDMYREVIEHPWSIPDEIKKHIDLNSGNDRGRIYRIVPDKADWKRRASVDLSKANTEELVKTLEHENGWHRDCAARLLYERNDKAAVPLLEKMVSESPSSLGRLHALCALEGFGAVNERMELKALADKDEHVRERAILVAERTFQSSTLPEPVWRMFSERLHDSSAHVRFQLALTVGQTMHPGAVTMLASLDATDRWIADACLSAPPAMAFALREGRLAMNTMDDYTAQRSLFIIGARNEPSEVAAILQQLANYSHPKLEIRADWIRSFASGLKRAGTTIAQVDTDKKLAAVFTKAVSTAGDARAPAASRLEALSLLSLATFKQAQPALLACLAKDQAEVIQAAAVSSLGQFNAEEVTQALLERWPDLADKARGAALTEFLARPERTMTLLKSIQDSAPANEKGSAGFQPA